MDLELLTVSWVVVTILQGLKAVYKDSLLLHVHVSHVDNERLPADGSLYVCYILSALFIHVLRIILYTNQIYGYVLNSWANNEWW